MVSGSETGVDGALGNVIISWAMVASWALSDEDAEWSRKTVDWTDDGELFKRQYRALNRAFDPVAFQPEEWAKMAKECGFRYLILTTKHHDGFCLWDTAYTEYKTTAEECPFHTHKYADIVRAMFDAFRKEGLGIGAYFSKADWHCPDYWETEKALTQKTTRNPTYDPKENPEAVGAVPGIYQGSDSGTWKAVWKAGYPLV